MAFVTRFLGIGMARWRRVLPGVAAAVFLSFPANAAWADGGDRAGGSWASRGWSIAGFGGVLTNNNTSEILTKGEWTTDAGVAGLALGKEIVALTSAVDLEGELHGVHRFSGQDVWEAGAMLLGRWKDPVLAETLGGSSIAAGYGVSLADRVPDQILREEGGTSEATGVLVVELEAGPRDPGSMAGFFRYQHRSSAFGLFGDDGQRDETTFFSLGLRYRF